MATGDQGNIVSRLQTLIPNGWFTPGMVPLRDALLSGVANSLAFIYSLLGYIRLQTRIATATDGWLDLIAGDFFGSGLYRYAGQTDDSFRARILGGVLRERDTRAAVQGILLQLTGAQPIIIEPQRPLDTGAYNIPAICGYGAAGAYGSQLLPYQSFVQAFRPGGQGIPNIAGYGIPTGAYSTPSQAEYASLSSTQGVTDADLYAAINSVRPAGYTIWVALQPAPH